MHARTRVILLLVALAILAVALAIATMPAGATSAGFDVAYSVDLCGIAKSRVELCYPDAPDYLLVPPVPQPAAMFVFVRHDDLDLDDPNESAFATVRFYDQSTGHAEIIIYPCFDSAQGGYCALDFREYPAWADYLWLDARHAVPDAEDGRLTLRIEIDWRWRHYLPLVAKGESPSPR